MALMSTTPVTFLAVDNHASILRGIGALAAERADEVRLIGTYAHVNQISMVPGQAPDVVLLDLYLGYDDDISTPWISPLRAWGAEVLLHTSTQAPVPLRQAVAAGASGLILKNDGDDALADAICAVAQGEFVCSSAAAHALLTDEALVGELTQREAEVIRGIADGLTVQIIARRARMSYETAKGHVKSVRRKYLVLGRDVTNAHSLVREARRDGWVDPQA